MGQAALDDVRNWLVWFNSLGAFQPVEHTAQVIDVRISRSPHRIIIVWWLALGALGLPTCRLNVC